MNSMNRTLPWLIAALLATAVVYWPGLQGAFIYDDITNFERLGPWLQGQIGWKDIVLEHAAGPMGRPLAMATFLANAGSTGMDPFYFKLTNLLLHLLIGLVVYALVFRLARRDPLIGRSPETAALLITAIWLLHPMMVGTVLYAVQRMAMLSALFTLLAMLTYLIARERIEAGRVRSGGLWIWIGVPAFTLLGVLSKENALLAPIVCAVVEWVYFRPKPEHRRPLIVRAFLCASVALPIVAGLALLLVRPEVFLQNFDNRPFTMTERLLTQGRVLFDYIGNLLLPIGPKMSLFRDDYAISTGLFTPWTTAIAWVGWMFILGLAYRIRNKIPAFTAGVGIFIVGHGMESSIFPLLLYFEHRNYLPSLGVFLAAAGVLYWMADRIRDSIDNPGTLAKAGLAALLLVLGGATFARATLWGSNEALVTQSLERFPDSRAARLALAELKMNRQPRDVDAAQAQYRHLLNLERPSTQWIGAAGLIASSCFQKQAIDQTALAVLNSTVPDTLEADVVAAVRSLARIVLDSGCPEFDPTFLAERITAAISAADMSQTKRTIWALEYTAALLYAEAEEFSLARINAESAWLKSSRNLAVGLLLSQIAESQGDRDTAMQTLLEIERLISPDDVVGLRLLENQKQSLNINEDEGP